MVRRVRCVAKPSVRRRSGHSGMANSLRLTLLLIGSALGSAGNATCQYWLAEESNVGGYSKYNLSGTGLQSNRTISVNGDDFGAGKTLPYANGTLSHMKMGLDDFLQMNRSFIRSLVARRLVPRIVGGVATTNVIVLDLEYPFPWVHPCEYGTLNETTLAAVINATRLRIQVIRELMPHAGIGLYSTVGCVNPLAQQGYLEAAKLGLFDEITHLVPVLYMGAKTMAQKLASSTLDASAALNTTNGRRLKMLPLFTWLESKRSGGRFYSCSLELAKLHNLLADVAAWDASQPGGPGTIAAYVFWTPGDVGEVSAPGHDCGRNSPQETYLEWLHRAHVVPRGCLHY